MPFAIILMVGASCAFINPAGFQTNLMVQGPGGYRFNDFAKVGLPLTVKMRKGTAPVRWMVEPLPSIVIVLSSVGKPLGPFKSLL